MLGFLEGDLWDYFSIFSASYYHLRVIGTHLRVPLWILISIGGLLGFVSSIVEVFSIYVRSSSS